MAALGELLKPEPDHPRTGPILSPEQNVTPHIMLSVGKEKRTLLKFDHHWGMGLMTAEPNEGLYWGFTFSCEVTLVMQ